VSEEEMVPLEDELSLFIVATPKEEENFKQQQVESSVFASLFIVATPK